MSYNMVFTALPIMVLGVMDYDLDVTYSLRYTPVYYEGISNSRFNARVFII